MVWRSGYVATYQKWLKNYKLLSISNCIECLRNTFNRHLALRIPIFWTLRWDQTHYQLFQNKLCSFEDFCICYSPKFCILYSPIFNSAKTRNPTFTRKIEQWTSLLCTVIQNSFILSISRFYLLSSSISIPTQTRGFQTKFPGSVQFLTYLLIYFSIYFLFKML